MLVGPTGGGKSSLINTLFTSLRAESDVDGVSSVADVGRTDENTMLLQRYAPPDTKYRLWDTRGWVQHDPELAAVLEAAMRGELKEGFDFRPRWEGGDARGRSMLEHPANADKLAMRRTPDQRVHVVVVVVGADQIANQDVVSEMRRIPTLCATNKVPYFVAVSKVDERENLDEIASVDEFARRFKPLQEQVSQQLDIPERLVQPLANYTQACKKRHVYREELLLRLVRRVMADARERERMDGAEYAYKAPWYVSRMNMLMVIGGVAMLVLAIVMRIYW
eukprot:TRINITY_DN2683_c0_g1_i2.p2 TRINITY_DN2683_c0_g1~~TRINITY_DN2683_c0_g1_i2.p2  ORF type:complete len:279 (+),score=90.20 TRINITY_DN2683_c0_g1_i2:855-1691(+)